MNTVIILGFLAYLGLLYLGVGLTLRKYAPKEVNLLPFYSYSVIGIAIYSIGATLGYFYGLSLENVFWIFNAIALWGWRSYLYEADSEIQIFPKTESLVSLAGFIMIMLPGLIGGKQFTIFQGNHYDTYNYLESAITYAHFPKKVVENSSLLGMAAMGGFPYAIHNLTLRPTVAICYGALQFFSPRYFTTLHYYFLAYSIFLTGGVLGLFVKLTRNGIKSSLALILGLIFSIGFWGQYILDINAWSQTIWMPVEMLCIAIWLAYCIDTVTLLRYNIQNSIVLSFILVGAYYLYPEGFVFLVLPVLVCTMYLTGKGNLNKIILALLIILLVSSISCIPVWSCNVMSVVTQFRDFAKPNEWWRFFQGFMHGRDGVNNSIFVNFIDGIAGAIGCYYIAPGKTTSLVMALSIRIMIIMFITFVIYQVIELLIYKPRPKMIISLILLVLLGLCECLWLYLRIQYWSSGKGLSYISPLLVCLIILLAICTDRIRLVYNFKLYVVSIFIFTQLIFGLYRIYSVTISKNGIHYEIPYPSIQDEGIIKKYFDFSDQKYLSNINNYDTVAINVNNKWLEHYVQMELIARSIPNYLELPIHESSTSNNLIGKLKTSVPPNKRISLSINKNKKFYLFLETRNVN